MGWNWILWVNGLALIIIGLLGDRTDNLILGGIFLIVAEVRIRTQRKGTP